MNITSAQTLAIGLMTKHGLIAKGWSFSFDKAKSRYGCCHYRKKTITLSKSLVELNSISQTTDTILHEIAHALAGHKAGHYNKWKRQALAIGATPNRCYGAEVIQPPHNWVGTCPNGHTTERLRRNKNACKECCDKHNGGKYSKDFLFTWTPNEAL